MGREVELLVNYPRMVRDIEKRADEKSEEDKAVARQFGRDFFDGDRRYGYEGFSYQKRFWQPVAPTFRSHYGMGDGYSLPDVGCAKGSMMHDFSELVTG